LVAKWPKIADFTLSDKTWNWSLLTDCLYTAINCRDRGNVYAADSMGLASFSNTMYRVKWLIYSTSRSQKVIKTSTNQEPVCDFQLVANSKLDHSPHAFWNVTTKNLGNSCFYPKQPHL